MGSGTITSYSRTSGNSQPYSNTYSVIKNELFKDKKDPDIYDSRTGYFKNPLAISIESAIFNGHIYMDGKIANGKMTYVMNEQGHIIFAKRFNPNNERKRSPHPTLIGGKNPKVQCAGMIEFSRGKIVSIDNMSGHYRPNKKSLSKVDTFLSKLAKNHPEIFSPKSKWRN